MDPFQQQTFFAEPHWQYPNADATFVPVAEGQEMTYFHPPGHAAYPIEQSDSTAQVQYMSEQPAPRVNEAQIFPIPGGVPATTYPIVRVRRPARRDLTDTDDGERREKIRRTRTACEECRKRKQKCDGGEPCHPCSEQSTKCCYRDVPPTKKDDTMDRMLQLAENYNKTLACLTKDLDVMSGTLRSIEQRLEKSWRAESGASGGSVEGVRLGYRQQARVSAEQSGREQMFKARPSSTRQRDHC